MKRFSFNSGLFIAGLLFICSCADDSISEKLRATSDYMSLELNVNTINIKGDASTQTVYVWASSSVSWVIEDIPSWITVSPRNGTGDAVVTMSFGANTQSKRSATLSVRCTDTDWPARVNLSVSQDVTTEIGTHDYVDLGLSVKWATCNVGASKPEESGDYYAWGETKTKTKYKWSTYIFCSSYTDDYTSDDVMLSKYNTHSSRGGVDNKTELDLEDDVAHVKWGGSWRLPTKTELFELVNNCTVSPETLNGVSGFRFRSNITGYTNRSIFMPTTGFMGNNLVSEGTWFEYWSSSLYANSPVSACVIIYHYNSSDVNPYISAENRYWGHVVRPVRP